MSHLSRCKVLLLLLLISALPTLAQVLQSPEPANPPQTPQVLSPRHHTVPFRSPGTAVVGFAAPAGAHLSYFGGPVISNVHVVQVLYGSGSFDAQVAGTTSPTMGQFYGDLTG